MMKKTTGIGNSGLTLVELLVVIGIVAVLAVALGFQYQGWIGNYKIESQTKDLYSDLMEARARALTRNFPYLVSATSGQYNIAEDTNNSGKIDAGDTLLWPNPKTIESGHKLKLFSGGAFPTDPDPLIINTRGLLSTAAGPVGTVYVGIDSTGFTPDYDCIIITTDRIRMGKWDGGASCAEK